MFGMALGTTVLSPIATALATSAIAMSVLILVVAIGATVLWVGRDARARGFRSVWLLQVLMCLQFPWVFLTYLVVTQNMDRLMVRAA